MLRYNRKCWYNFLFLKKHSAYQKLTHWCRLMDTYINKLTITGSGNALLPDRHKAFTWTNAEILLIGTLGTNFSDILIAIKTFQFMKMHLKMSSAKWQPFCLGLNVLSQIDATLKSTGTNELKMPSVKWQPFCFSLNVLSQIDATLQSTGTNYLWAAMTWLKERARAPFVQIGDVQQAMICEALVLRLWLHKTWRCRRDF